MGSRRQSLVLILILTAGALLRLWGIDFGLPYQFHQDEPIIVNHALAYGTGDLNPHFFIIPPLASYILFFFYAVYFVILKLAGIVKDSGSFAVSFFKDPSAFYIIGRVALGLLPSVFSVYLTCRLAKKIFSVRTALYSAAFMALAFLNVINAHYMYTDNLLVMFALLSLFRYYMIIERPVLKNYILAGFFTGVAIAVKYNAAILGAPFLVAHYIATVKDQKRRLLDTRIFLYFFSIGVAFALCNPFAILDRRFFLLSIMTRTAPGHIGFSHHIAHSLFEGIGTAAAILGIAVLAISLFLRRRQIHFFVVAFPLTFYLHLVFMSQLHSRYVLPAVPFIAIGLGFLFFDCIYPKVKAAAAKAFTVFAACAILFPTTIKSITADMLFSKTDTRAEAAQWIEKNIRPFTKIAFDNTSFIPQLRHTASQMRQKSAILGRQPELKDLKAKKMEFQIKALEGEKTYEIYYLARGDENKGQFLNLWPMIPNTMEELKARKIEYAVFNSMTDSDSMKMLHQGIAQDYSLVAEFNPYKEPGFRAPYDEIETTCIPIKSRELFSRTRPGPYIKIYSLK